MTEPQIPMILAPALASGALAAYYGWARGWLGFEPRRRSLRRNGPGRLRGGLDIQWRVDRGLGSGLAGWMGMRTALAAGRRAAGMAGAGKSQDPGADFGGRRGGGCLGGRFGRRRNRRLLLGRHGGPLSPAHQAARIGDAVGDACKDA